MSDHGGYTGTRDTRFALPAVDDPASTETGVILLGLGADRLLAGLGLTTGDEDPATVTLLVDLARHGAPDATSFADAVAAGISRWWSARAVLGTDVVVAAAAAPRQAWAQAYRMLAGTGACPPGSAEHSYLTACWLRRDEIDRYAAPAPISHTDPVTDTDPAR